MRRVEVDEVARGCTIVFSQPFATATAPSDSTTPSTPPSRPTSSHSTTCCTNTCLREAPRARRTPISGARARNFASRRPIRLSAHTARNSSDTTSITVSSRGVTSCSDSHSSSGVTSTRSGRAKRPCVFCSVA